MTPSYTITSSTLSVLADGRQLSLSRTSPLWDRAIDALRAQQWATLVELLTPAKAVENLSKGNFTISQDCVLYRGERIPDCLEKRILEFWELGLDFTPLLNFFERLAKNPSKNSVEQLYTFLQNKNIPISQTGTFFAYKAIRMDWLDIYSGTISNHIGAQPVMERRKVDDNSAHHCSQGLHVGGLDYVKMYGSGASSRYVIVEVDPANVVSVPTDHNFMKVRVTTYRVVEEYRGPLPETVYSPLDAQYDDDEWYEEDETIFEIYESELEEGRCPFCGDEVNEHWYHCPACGGNLNLDEDQLDEVLEVGDYSLTR